MNNLKKAQSIMLNTLIEVDKICKKYNINYWLDSGTLLGAVRDKGFIPWDDDLDICMMLDEYQYFLSIVKDELPKEMILQTKEAEKSFPYDYAKIRDSRGKIIEAHEKDKSIQYNQGIFIDIIPCIAISNSKLSKFLYKINFLVIKLFSYKYLNIIVIREFLIKINDKLIFDKNGSMVTRSGKFPSYLLYIEKSNIFPLKKIEFENKEFFGPNNFNEYLKVLYGDNYMQLPPKSKRVQHAIAIEIKK